MKKVFRKKFNKYFFNEVIKEELEASGFTQQEMGRLLGVSGKTISAYLHNQVCPSVEVLIKFFQAFDKKLLVMDKWDDIEEFN